MEATTNKLRNSWYNGLIPAKFTKFNKNMSLPENHALLKRKYFRPDEGKKEKQVQTVMISEMKN